MVVFSRGPPTVGNMPLHERDQTNGRHGSGSSDASWLSQDTVRESSRDQRHGKNNYLSNGRSTSPLPGSSKMDR